MTENDAIYLVSHLMSEEALNLTSRRHKISESRRACLAFTLQLTFTHHETKKQQDGEYAVKRSPILVANMSGSMKLDFWPSPLDGLVWSPDCELAIAVNEMVQLLVRFSVPLHTTVTIGLHDCTDS